MSTEEKVASHYTHGSLGSTILGGLTASGKDIDHLSVDDLAGIDEFHLGRREATVEFAKDLELLDGMRLIDVGSGLGGSARYIGSTYGCIVTGIDLTDEFVNVANDLTARCGMAMQVSFHQGSALALPLPDESFDRATLIHVGMNIEDKAALFAEVRRVLKRGGRFGLYEIMQVRDGTLPYPMPWAMTAETSFVCSPATYRQLLKKAGFTVEFEQDRSALAIRMAQEMRASAANGGQALSLGALMGPTAAERMGNISASVGGGLVAPIEMIAKAG
ncbi:class I SAM-dependent methyltransferase [Rhizobium sp. BR 362]|uniref:class I SAM-dependent methyltransferase n=1 Tax=Rhizobium sp. BR 362 TaxID=3040670 RepID=UPI002F3FBF9D